MWKITALVVSFLIVSVANAQNEVAGKLKVYIDCRVGCDFNYFKSEINIVDFVLDPTTADVHVLLTAQAAGSGGAQYQMNFYGQNQYENYSDTLLFNTLPNATPSDVRKTILRYLMFGFSPLIAKTPFASQVKMVMKEDSLNARPPYENDPRDKWNFWVFRVAASGQYNAERVYKNNVISSAISANRTTNKLKVEFYLNANLRNSVYTYEDSATTTQYKVKNTDYRLYHNLVRSFSDHWSYGYQTNLSNSTFDNIKRKIFFSPAIEYNVYDYKEVNNRFFVLRYGLDISNNNYYDTTIYYKIRETVYGHRFSAAITLNKKWGTFNGGIYYRNYFQDWALNAMGLSANADVRIGGGLSFFVHASGSVFHNQINLVKGGVTEQEVLTRKRQLASSFNYYTSFGLAFRFGSILNNFVNPRFDGYAGF
ncbi:hypothetical protein [Segetibacter koreensis]|uniref:hypothetical protein n=1 Tax=Segetibacter koreensis TaxID=398037 RepID=UPI0003694C48|nr:hypothetical protein [Segetibacter koreensis]